MTVRVQAAADDVTIVTLDDGGHGNPLSVDSARTIAAELAAASTSARAVVLAAAPGPFCAGGDREVLTNWHRWEPPARAEVLADGPQHLLRTLLELPVPTVAAIDGVASGAGLDIALACDLRVLGPGARLVSSYVDVGVVPGDGGAWLLPRHVGLGRAMDLLLTGRTVGAEEAIALGLAHELVDSDRVQPRASELAVILAQKPDGAVAAIRRAVLDGAAQDVRSHLQDMRATMAVIAGTRAHAEAVERRLGSGR